MEPVAPIAYAEQDTQPLPQVEIPDEVTPSIPPAPNVAATRSQKADMGLSKTMGIDYKTIYNDIAAGKEPMFRERAASQLNFQAAMDVENKLVKGYKDKGSPLTIDEAKSIIDPWNSGPKADPVSVIERAYATSYVSSLNTADAYMRDTVMAQAAKEIPEELSNKRNMAEGLVSTIETAKTLRQNLENEISNQSWPSWMADQAKSLLQPYNEFKLRGLNPEVGKITGGLLLGDNMKAQADQLWMRPTDERIKTLTNIIDGLRKDNPSLAREFLDYFIGQADSDRLLQNMFTILSPLDYASAVKGGAALTRKAIINNRAGAAFKDMVKQAAKEDTMHVPVQAVAQEAAGDVPGAAVTRASERLEQIHTNTVDPVIDAKESLMSGMRLDGDLLDSNPGNLSRSDLTMLKDSFVTSAGKLWDTINSVLRVNRTPEALRDPDALRAYRDAERARYPGLDNAILDISSPQYMRSTNTYWINHTFGNYAGRLFSDPETALAWAKQAGFADARIIEATGEVERVGPKLAGSTRDLKALPQTERALENSKAMLKNINEFLSKKFVGPKTPLSVEKATSDKKLIEEQIIPNYEKKLADIKSRVVMSAPVIEQNGVGYKVTIVRPYRETDDTVRQWLINSDKSKSSASMTGWNSWKNSWLGWVRNADDTLAFNESVNRKIANYTQAAIRRWAADEAKYIEAISSQATWYKPWTYARPFTRKEMFEEFNATLKHAKSMRDPQTGEIGYFFKTPGELQDHYQRFYNRLPSPAETQAYFAHIRILEGNRVLSEIAEFRNRARLGTEQHQLFFLDGTKKAGSGFFDAIEQKEFPGGSDQILIMGSHKGDERLYHLGANNIPMKDLKRYRDLVAQGKARILRIYDPDSRPLKGFSDVGDARIRYVMTTDSESKPLAFNHVNRRGGGHFDVDSDWYVKQASIVQELAGSAAQDKRKVMHKTYTGDWTLMPIENRVLGHDIAQKMTKMNGFMKNQQYDEAKALARTMGIDWEQVESWYKPKTAPNGRVIGPPSIDWDEPFYVVPRNKKIFDIDKSLEDRIGKQLFKDGTKSGSDAQQFQVAYNQARDSELMSTIKNEGTHANPAYKYVPAEYVDPIPSLNRAMNRAISSTFMDDYKIYAVEHWLREAIPHMKYTENEIRSAPFWHFNNADRGAFKSATEADAPGLIDNLMSNRFKIRQFTGMPNKVDTYIHGMTQLLVDEFYKKTGSESERSGLTKAFTVVPIWALSKVTDASALRSFAFNAKLGLFSIPQFLVQAQTFTNIWAISPRAGAGGTFATMLHTWSRINSNPEVLRAMDNMASKLNFFGHQWKPGWWMEARQELARTGFEHVGGEYLLADDVMTHNFFKGQFGKFLDAGQVFFKEGEKATRLGAYYTAFLEWRHANPTRVITDAVRGEILQRADLLTNNMSRASSSALNTSILSLPTQFLSYQIHAAELFLGKRLGGTTSERVAARARLMGFFAAMYGAPSAIGITGYPFGDSIREYAVNHGYVIGDNQIEDLVMNGIPAWTMAMISGGGDYKKGNQYNFGNRYGSQGMTFIRESMRSDETVWKLIGGAAGSTIVNTITSFDPFWQAAKSLVSDDEEGNAFKLAPAHFDKIFSEISSVDSAKRMLYAMHTGRWLSKNEQYIENVTGLDALYRTITGLRSQQQDDIFTLKNIRDQDAQNQKEAEREIIKEYRRGIQATEDKNDALATTYFTNARARMIAAGIPLDRRAALMASASRGYEKQIDTSVTNWATKNVPHGQEETRVNALSKYLQLQDYRNH